MSTATLPMQLVRLDRALSREVIYRQLKSLILNLTLKPDQDLKDTELAERLGVSRMPVREALRKLQDEGLVAIRRNRWTRVAALDLQLVVDTYPVLQSLQVTALRLAFDRLGPEVIQELRALNQQMDIAGRGQQGERALVFDGQFHRTIVTQADNLVLSQTIQSLSERLFRIELAYFSSAKGALEAVNEHHAIIEAIQRRDLEAAARHLAANWTCPESLVVRS